ncbi:acyltransferase [Metapseudomonas lalkuanensis]|uniref:acyltransferase family protein n=1 Tax=Metapseudomonas lalkuanensis TaxID=2604832 RepID=UPI001CF26757|nr:acyltransferase [Pseudomonas lalkuanensis]UCO97922.1 acyltransferase [Pseudomonas lalkuanensis]
MTDRPTLENIQALRWIAAALVFIQHSVYFAGMTVGDQMLSFRGLNLGGIGVYIFFIISGFVIALQTNKNPAHFLMHRVFRIYPGYLVAIIFSTTVFFLFSAYRPTFSIPSVSMLLIPTGSLNSSFQIPYWTLIYEMFFYALVLLLMIVHRNRSKFIDASIFIWMLGIITSMYVGTKIDMPKPGPSEILVSPLNLYFICGFFLSRIFFSKNPGLAYLALFLMAAAGCFILSMRYQATISAMGIAAIVMAVKSKPLPNLLNKLGDYSYGIYLAHLPVIYCIHLALKDSGTSFAGALALMTVAALPAAILFGRIEHGLYKGRIRPAVDRLFEKKISAPMSPSLEKQ